MGISKPRVSTSANLKSKKNAAIMRGTSKESAIPSGMGGITGKGAGGSSAGNIPSNILLARGLSARYCGANIPLTGLTNEEIERDLRHMEAFSNACIAYAQQYYIYQNSTAVAAAAAATTSAQVASTGVGNDEDDDDDEDNDEEHHHHNNNKTKNGKKIVSSSSAPHPPIQPAPIIAMPVRIDPEEEKRLVNLRLKIQQCESQREVLESQYLSLRAHYVYMSQRLKNSRRAINGRVEFLQSLLKKRGTLVALQRARLQISREVLACLHYRQSGGKVQDEPIPQQHNDVNDGDGIDGGTTADLLDVWNKIDEQFKKAEESCRVATSTAANTIVHWSALKVPKVPPGVPLLMSQLAKPPGFAAAWGTAGMFGSNAESLCWLEADFPEPAHRTKSLAAMRDEVDVLKRELDKERNANRDLQTNIIARRKANIELVAMMALLRTETEAVVARHNILLESNVAKEATQYLQHVPQDHHNNDDDDDDDDEEEAPSAAVRTVAPREKNWHVDGKDAVVAPKTAAVNVANTSTTTTTTAATTTTGSNDPTAMDDAPATIVNTTTTTTTTTTNTPADDENDGDDEGEAGDDEDEEEGELVESNGSRGGTAAAAAAAIAAGGSEKRGIEDAGSSDGSSPRNKRRKV